MVAASSGFYRADAPHVLKGQGIIKVVTDRSRGPQSGRGNCYRVPRHFGRLKYMDVAPFHEDPSTWWGISRGKELKWKISHCKLKTGWRTRGCVDEKSGTPINAI
jgi:hypothetical protein